MEYSDLLTNYFFTSIENLLNISVSDLLWPLPHSINSTNYPLELIKFDKIELDDCSLSDETCKTLLNSLKITINSLRSKCNYDVTNSSALLFKIKFKIDFDDILNPQQLLHVDESYVLTVSPKLMEIQAKTRIGFIYAMQTLSQLVISTKKNCYIAAAQIIDKPRFSHRGFMLDSSRNFFSVNDIKRQLDAMFYTKLNVLHWHIYDAQSFPIKWEYDGGRLYKNSAYKWDDGSLKVYSKNDVKDIIDYAFQLGIRIIPEFDMPGHTTVFSKAYPEIMKCADFGPGFDGQKGINWVKRRCNQPPCGQLNPDAEKTYVIIEQFLKDMGEWVTHLIAFESIFIHL
ncbi:hypothetical protein HK099_005796 [Clydaea vesicula]|uniref:beta-N-acetylhexosaminidase n=1 Tax=Clydaea vesicula TaxID=447962 RepID=A0AAD5U0M6_9FUNG|nr:hypothetical protein HK099_005796 [Clydaea vesicula]